MSQDPRIQHQLRQTYLPAHSHGEIPSPFDMERRGKLPTSMRKPVAVEDDVSESSTRGSSPSTDWSYAESSQSSCGTSLPPDDLPSLSGAGGSSDCESKGDYRSPRPSEDADSPHPPSRNNRELRDNIPARRATGSPAADEAICEDNASSDSDIESDSEDDNDWSQDDGLESTVIASVGGNLALASYLIPIIYKNRNVEYAKMIHAWQACGATQGAVQCSPGANHQSSPTVTSSSMADSRSGSGSGRGGPFKKRKRSNSDDFGRKDDEGDGDDEGSGDRGSPIDTGSGVLLLACPFHKRDPVKYSAKSGATAGKKTKSYRACAGPGWKSIQRLKEHLRRNHSPVQCSRCFRTFYEPDRPSSMLRLQQHQREPVQCQVGDQSLREGISEVQWAELDKKKAKRQDGERVGKWFEIWDILFPDTTKPQTPFYDWASGPQSTLPSNPGKEQLMSAFGNILDHMVEVSGDINFNGNYEHIRSKLLNVAGTAFDVYRSTSGGSSEDSSSLTKTNTNSKKSGDTHQTAATSITLPVSPVTPSSQNRPVPSQQQQQPQQQQQQQQQQQYHNPAMPRTMPPTQYAPMMAQMQTQVPPSPPMPQITNFGPYYQIPAMNAATAWSMSQSGFEGAPYLDANGMPLYFPTLPDSWDTNA